MMEKAPKFKTTQETEFTLLSIGGKCYRFSFVPPFIKYLYI